MRITTLATLTVCLAAFAAPSAGWSQECAPTDESQMCMNTRAGADYKTEDAKLNNAYHEIMQPPVGFVRTPKKLLQASQRAWIAFRDAECEFSTDRSKDGSIYPMVCC